MEEETKKKKVDTLRSLFREMDKNQDQKLSYEEFYEHLSKKAGKNLPLFKKPQSQLLRAGATFWPEPRTGPAKLVPTLSLFSIKSTHPKITFRVIIFLRAILVYKWI